MKKFAIFGNPISHSKSPQMHNSGFDFLNLNAKYFKILLEDGKNLKTAFLEYNLSGANITVPHKEVAFLLADEVRGIAKQIKAVNTYILEEQKVVAYNTDAPGFLKAIESFGEIDNVLILGAGGTAKAISCGLVNHGKSVTVTNRSAEKLAFFEDIGCKIGSYEEIWNSKFDLIVNTTSAGLKDDHLPAPQYFVENLLKNTKFVFDCIYGKLTPFLSLAKKMGVQYKDGEDMLLYQGVLAFELFCNVEASVELIHAMREGLKKV